jgi:hypothetical protein
MPTWSLVTVHIDSHQNKIMLMSNMPAQVNVPGHKSQLTPRDKNHGPDLLTKAATSKPKNAKSKPEDFRLWIDPNDKSNVTTVHQIRKTLEQGQQITAKLCAANYETATELRTLAKAHDLNTTAETAIVIMYGEAPDDAETAWIRVQSRGSGAELRRPIAMRKR